MPDFFTLFVVVLLLNLSHCLLWGMIAYRYKDLRAARFWLASSSAGAAGGVALSLQGEGGLIIQTVTGNGLVILGFYLSWCGAREFHGDKVRWVLISLLVVGSIFVMLATFHLWHGRNPVYTLAQSLPLGLTIVYLLGFFGRDLGASVAGIAMLVGAVSHCIIAGGNILIVTGVNPDLQLYHAASIDLLIFLFAAVIWNFGFLISAVERLRSQVERLANEDELTGIANRRNFMSHLHRVCDAARAVNSFSLFVFDLDRFKAINDKYGHAAGDAALRHVAAVIMKELRPRDVFARLGGDEFGLLLPATGAAEAASAAKRIVNAVKSTPLPWGAAQLSLTVSIGIVSQHCSRTNPESLLDSADCALYETKRRGRNGYTVFGSGRDVTSNNIIHLADFSASGSAAGS